MGLDVSGCLKRYETHGVQFEYPDIWALTEEADAGEAVDPGCPVVLCRTSRRRDGAPSLPVVTLDMPLRDFRQAVIDLS